MNALYFLAWPIGAAQGFFDLEAIQLLSYFRKNPDRQMIYNQVSN